MMTAIAAATTMHHAVHDHLFPDQKRNNGTCVVARSISQFNPDSRSRGQAPPHAHPFDGGLDHTIRPAQAGNQRDNPCGVGLQQSPYRLRQIGTEHRRISRYASHDLRVHWPD